MSRWSRIREKIFYGQSNSNIEFADLVAYLLHLGFSERIVGDHHILYRHDVIEIINIQPLKDGKAKAYQVRQVRELLRRSKLGDE